jgi:hypothetical protein
MEMTGMTRRTFGRIAGLTLATALVTAGSTAFAEGEKIAVITPYLSQPGTQFYVEAFQARAKELGWDVNVIDTAGDVAAVISRMEDVSAQGVNAIVLNVDPAQVGAGLDASPAAPGAPHPQSSAGAETKGEPPGLPGAEAPPPPAPARASWGGRSGRRRGRGAGRGARGRRWR